MERYLEKEDIVKNPLRGGEYKIIEQIGRGASAAVYKSSYSENGVTYEHILKEYNPLYIVLSRNMAGQLLCKDEDVNRFEEGKRRFIDAGKTENILRSKETLKNQTPPLFSIFEENNTVYIDVTPYAGKTYDRVENISMLERMKICLSVAKLVQLYHLEGYLCLDIKPENIFVLRETTEIVEFIDFDSVREKNKISFGNSLSFTKLWAAPEQKIPHAVHQICEATDVYTIGELVFWSIFGRHSEAKEHRGYSEYPFDDKKMPFVKELSRFTVRKILTQLFRKTLRSSVHNRYATMSELIAVLEALIDELTKKEYIIASVPDANEFFIGRENEILQIERHLEEQRLLFLYGIGGIGKSEIAKQYVKRYKEAYDNVLYWTYTGNLERMICDEQEVSIANVIRSHDQLDNEYCSLKLRKLKKLLSGNSLIVIDNFDIKLTELEQKTAWELLMALPCKFLITTKSKQLENILHIEELADKKDLKNIFMHHYCANQTIAEEQMVYVEQILENVKYHTLLTELIAKQAKAAFMLPQDMLIRLQQAGIGSFKQEVVGLKKDGHSDEATVIQHLKKVFSMSDMNFEQRLLLTKMAFMPRTGISPTVAKELFWLENYNKLDWLIDSGWVKRNGIQEVSLTVHPVIASIVVENAKEDKQILDILVSEFIDMMCMGYDSSDEMVDHVRSYLKRDYVLLNVKQHEYVGVCDGIAFFMKKYNLSSSYVYNFLVLYMDWFRKYGKYEEKVELALYAIEIYDQMNSAKKYSRDREVAYDRYVSLLLELGVYEEKVVATCKERFDIAKHEKDWILCSFWCFNLANIYFYKGIKETSKYNKKAVKYIGRALGAKSLKGLFESNFQKEINKALCKQTELGETSADYFFAKSSVHAINILKLSNFQRKVNEFTDSETNRIVIQLNSAKIKIRQFRYQEAINLLLPIWQECVKFDFKTTTTSYKVCELLADTYFTIAEYTKAEEMYEYCLKFSKELGYVDDYSIRICLGRIYNLVGKLEKAMKHNQLLLLELEKKTGEQKRYLLADAYYNNGELQMMKKDAASALEYFETAQSIYVDELVSNMKVHQALKNAIGVGRCKCWIAIIAADCGRYNESIECMKEGIELLERSLGARHPEVIALKELCIWEK